MNESFYKRMFLVGSLWNVVGGALMAAATSLIFSTAGLQTPDPPLYYYSWIALFITFGIGYYMIYRDMYGNKNIVRLGIIGKLAFSAIFLASVFMFPGQVPLLFLGPIAGDLIFVVLFWKFLRFAKQAGR